MYLAGLNSLLAVFTERVVAKTCKRLTGPCDTRTLKACGLRADRSTSLKVSAEGVAHSCDKELYGRVCDNCRINHYCVGICRVEQVFIKAVVVVVNYGQSGAGSVCCGNGRYDNDVFSAVIRSCLCGIYCASAADCDNSVDIVGFNDGFHLVYLAVAGNTAENLVTSVIVKVTEALFYLIVAGLVTAV